MKVKSKKLEVYADGGSRGNPGNAGIGVCVVDPVNGIILEKRYKNVGIKTNNEAEYIGAFLSIKRAVELGATEIDLLMDSNLVINQLSGVWKIKKDELKVLYEDVKKLIFEKNVIVNFKWIPRELNAEADRLSNVAMDQGKKE